MILDCTLRDGGYLNNWDWDWDFAKSVVRSLYPIVDIIEIGYRTPRGIDKYKSSGFFRFCDDGEFFSDGIGDFKSKLGVMIDLSDYLDKHRKLDKILLCQMFDFAERSAFTYVRVAIVADDIKQAIPAIEHLYWLGYKVILSVMKISTLDRRKLLDIQSKLAYFMLLSKLYSFHVADSFGALKPADIDKLIQDSDQFTHIGLHTHNNTGLALSNALRFVEVYIKQGIDNCIVDTSIMGIGRGAGNCDLLEYLPYSNDYKYEDAKQIVGLHSKFATLKRDFDWGKNYLYAYAARLSVHPNYVVNLLSIGLSDYINIRIMERLEGHQSYSKDVLGRAINSVRDDESDE